MKWWLIYVKVVWDPFAYEQSQGAVPLAAAEYTLLINDERGQGSGVKGGYLTPYTGTKFSLYRPLDYTPIESTFHFASARTQSVSDSLYTF